MRLNKSTIIIMVITISVTAWLTGIVRDHLKTKEKQRLESILSPLVDKATEGGGDPKPRLSFVSPTKKSIILVVRWEQKPEAAIKNEMRERIMLAARKELAADPASWGRHISIVFDDEVITQGWK